jgi:hypothetical protein
MATVVPDKHTILQMHPLIFLPTIKTLGLLLLLLVLFLLLLVVVLYAYV